MNPSNIADQAKAKFTGAVAHFEEELKKLRTGRAHPSMLDGVMVVAYGVPMPLMQVGTVTTPEAQLLQITPFDPGNVQAISQAIRDNQSLGLNPVDDGRVVRVQVPQLTAERRQQIVKQLNEKVEESMIAMRQIRHEAFKGAEQAKKDKAFGEDECNRLEKQIDDMMAKSKSEIEDLAKAKERGILTV